LFIQDCPQALTDITPEANLTYIKCTVVKITRNIKIRILPSIDCKNEINVVMPYNSEWC
jgi:hypothetical protein